ncbi:KRAB-A domain-containing protein 2-like [Saccostrea echinata]|uniref:KRAB-A domain-containing protein 2-like n=1 Tax=Saccostrea echinata TaxID=191078 RepID=UPI002A80CEF3|nr:KRAB-A domain-containing protein 2-like [Saccostrea echinata]
MKRKYHHLLDEEEYDTIMKLVLGTFRIKCKDRTRRQKNAALKYWRNKNSFSVEDGELRFDGKRVLHKSKLNSVVKKAFDSASGCGARPLYVNLSKEYSAVSERKILREYNKSKRYQKFFPNFSNRPLNKAITADRVNERWQIDLIDMKNDVIKSNCQTYRYILSILDVFSRFLILRPLKRKTSRQIAIELERVFSEHGKPSILQCDQGTEFKGRFERMLHRNKIKLIRSRPYHPQSQGKCERSHRVVRNKIAFLKTKRRGFNWAAELHKVQFAINENPKEVLGYLTPSEVYTSRQNKDLLQKVRKASERCNRRKQRRELRQGERRTYFFQIPILISRSKKDIYFQRKNDAKKIKFEPVQS